MSIVMTDIDQKGTNLFEGTFTRYLAWLSQRYNLWMEKR